MATPAPSSSNYSSALSRFDQQTEELKKLLDEDDIVSTTSDEEEDSSSDEEDGSSGEEDSSSDEDDSDEYSSDGDESDYEDLAAEFGLPGAGGMKKGNSSPALMALGEQMEKVQAQENILPGFLNLKDRMRASSGNNLYMQSPDFTTKTAAETVDNPYASTKPDDHLKAILEGFSACRFPSETWHDYFKKMTDENIEAHTTEVEMAVRNQDYDTLREMLRNGHTLQTCNRHGESIVHVACRRGTTELVQFLFHEAKVDPRIRDDMGRTPLHDVCWTHKPNFGLVMELLNEAPELLFIVDHRGFTPLTYVPREAWGKWCEFLQDNRHFLREMVKSLRFDRARYFIKTMVPCLKF